MTESHTGPTGPHVTGRQNFTRMAKEKTSQLSGQTTHAKEQLEVDGEL